MEVADQLPKPSVRIDTQNLVAAVSLSCVVAATASDHGLTYADVLYLVVLGVLAARYALSRAGVLPMREFEVSPLYTVAFIVVLGGVHALTQRSPAWQRRGPRDHVAAAVGQGPEARRSARGWLGFQR